MELSSQPHASAALLQGKEPPGWVGFSVTVGKWEKWILLPLPRIEPRFLGRPARSLVTVPTELRNKQFQAELIKLSFPVLLSLLLVFYFIYFFDKDGSSKFRAVAMLVPVHVQTVFHTQYIYLYSRLVLFKLNRFGSTSLLVVCTYSGCYYRHPNHRHHHRHS
jgi:hypothetical protein